MGILDLKHVGFVRLMAASSGSGSMSVWSMCSHPVAQRSSACGKPRMTSSRQTPRPVVRWSAPRGSLWVLSLASWLRALHLRQSLLFLMMWSMISRVVTRECFVSWAVQAIKAYQNLYWLVVFCSLVLWNLCGYYWLTLEDFAMVDASGYPASVLIPCLYLFGVKYPL